MIQLHGQSCIDVSEQELTPCHENDDNAWENVNKKCADRGLKLCSEDQYINAYTDSKIETEGNQTYAYTSTTCEKGHMLMKGQKGALYHNNDGCHEDKGCYPNRYYRCCSSTG